MDIAERHRFIKGISGYSYENDISGESRDSEKRNAYLEYIGKSSLAKTIERKYADVNLFDKYLFEFICDDDNDRTDIERERYYNRIRLTSVVKDALVSTLASIRTLIPVENYYRISYETTVDEIRDRIHTFNNLIVRLPTTTYTNRLISRHIFQDWRNFVQKSLEWLVDRGMLFRKEGQIGTGTDGIEHTYTEYYVDAARKVPLIEYTQEWSEEHDRFDYWSEDDFK